MKRCAFLTCADMTDFVSDDQLAVGPLSEMGVQVEFIPWNESVNWNNFDCAVIRSTWDYTEHLDQFLKHLERIDESRCRLLNPLSVVKWNCRKTYLQDLIARTLPVIPTLFFAKGQLCEDEILKSFIVFESDKIMLKPVVGANASGTYPLTQSSSLQDVLSLSEKQSMLCQPFLSSVVEEGEYSFHFFNKQFSHAILKTPKNGDFRVQEEHGGEIRPVHVSPSQIEKAAGFLTFFPDELLYARVDMVNDKNGQLVLMELELIEPSLYFRMDAKSPSNFASALAKGLLS